MWAYENRITAGKSDSLFGPESTINRAQVLMFLYRYNSEKPTTNEHVHEWEHFGYDTTVIVGYDNYWACSECDIRFDSKEEADVHSDEYEHSVIEHNEPIKETIMTVEYSICKTCGIKRKYNQ